MNRTYLKVEDPIFHLPVHVLLNYTPAQLARWEKTEYGVDGSAASCDGFAGLCWTFQRKDLPHEAVVWVRTFDHDIGSHQYLIHELTHVAIKLWALNHMQVSEHTQEFFAWTVDGLFGAVANGIAEAEEKRKRRPRKRRKGAVRV